MFTYKWILGATKLERWFRGEKFMKWPQKSEFFKAGVDCFRFLLNWPTLVLIHLLYVYNFGTDFHFCVIAVTNRPKSFACNSETEQKLQECKPHKLMKHKCDVSVILRSVLCEFFRRHNICITFTPHRARFNFLYVNVNFFPTTFLWVPVTVIRILS